MGSPPSDTGVEADVRSAAGSFAADLALAREAAAGRPEAIGSVMALLEKVAREVAARQGLGSDERDEITGEMAARLFTGRAAIGDYSGRGRLEAWLKVALIRRALNVRRGRARQVSLSEEMILGLPSPQRDPESSHQKSRARAEVRAALEAALADLDRRQRNLLRQHFVDGLLINDLAALYGVHRVTASQWLRRAEDELIAGARRRLACSWRISEAELEEMAALLKSRFELSLPAIFETSDASVPR